MANKFNYTVAPELYLAAGLPMPWESASGATQSEQPVIDVLWPDDVPRSSLGPKVRPTTFLSKVDANGTPVETVLSASHQHLAQPGSKSSPRRIGRVERDPSGLLRVHTHPRRGSRRLRRGSFETEGARLVTLDLSVALSDLEAARFAASDLLFINTALACDLEMHLESPMSGRVGNGISVARSTWNCSIPISIGESTREIYRALLWNELRRPVPFLHLEPVDLWSAASAILYGAPLYTVKPEAYKGLKNGLKVLKFGPIRNKDAANAATLPPFNAEETRVVTLVQARLNAESGPPPLAGRTTPESAPRATPPSPSQPSFASLLQKAYDDGDDADTRFNSLLLGAIKEALLAGESNSLVQAVSAIIADATGNIDPSWRVVVLEHADLIAATLDLLTDDEMRQDLCMVLDPLTSRSWGEAGDPSREHVAALAQYAAGVFGRWPQDASDDVLGDMEADPFDDESHDAYVMYLRMIGLSPSEIESERAGMEAGSIRPHRDRLNELAARHAAAQFRA